MGTRKYYVISNRFHGYRVLSAHRSMATATRSFERIDARHTKECTCGGPSIIDSTVAIPMGYSLAGSNGQFVAPASAV